MENMTAKQVREHYKGLRSTEQITSCPYCYTAKVKERRQRDQHCSGLWNTSVQFDCGIQFNFSPNLLSVEQQYMCTKSPEWKARIAKVDDLRAKLLEFAKEQGAHPEDVVKLKDKLEYWNPRYF